MMTGRATGILGLIVGGVKGDKKKRFESPRKPVSSLQNGKEKDNDQNNQ
jgi:hypothetical protein